MGYWRRRKTNKVKAIAIVSVVIVVAVKFFALFGGIPETGRDRFVGKA